MIEELAITVLENRKIEVKPIVRPRGFFKKGHDGEFMYSGCKQVYTLPMSYNTRTFINPFLNNTEAKQFEKLLNLEDGALNIYNLKNAFWGNFKVELKKEKKILDLNTPIHALEYRVMLANRDFFAPDWESRYNKGSYKYALVDEGMLELNAAKSAEKLDQAMEYMIKLKKSNKEMVNTLRLLQKNIPVSARDNTQWLKTQLWLIIEEKSQNIGVKNIDDFLTVCNDPKAKTKLFVLDAVENGDVVFRGSEYRIAETQQLIGKSLEKAVDWFDDNRNIEDRILIEDRLKLNNK